jgi:hypothetical protein
MSEGISQERNDLADVMAAKQAEWETTARRLKDNGLSIQQVAIAMKTDETTVRMLLKKTDDGLCPHGLRGEDSCGKLER